MPYKKIDIVSLTLGISIETRTALLEVERKIRRQPHVFGQRNSWRDANKCLRFSSYSIYFCYVYRSRTFLLFNYPQSNELA